MRSLDVTPGPSLKALTVLAFALSLSFVGCSGQQPEAQSAADAEAAQEAESQAAVDAAEDEMLANDAPLDDGFDEEQAAEDGEQAAEDGEQAAEGE